MNVHLAVCLPLLFLLAVLMPSMAFAEKGPAQSGVKDKVVQKVDDKQSIEINDSSDQANEQSTNENKSKNSNTSVENKGNVKDLPDQANDKAKEKVKEAVHKGHQNRDKEIKPDPPLQQQKEKDSRQKDKKAEDGNLSPKKEPVPKQEKTPDSDKEVDSSKDHSTDTEKAESTISNKVSKEEEDSPKHKGPIPLPKKKESVLYILQAQQSIKTPVGSSNDNNGSNHTKMDYLNGYTSHLGVRFTDPFVIRQPIFRNQWVNAPPTPPPKFALSFLSTV
ncbi:hypothetical protein D7Z54_29760 [Salibacterium salarium]|uniref:Uncharacterized protein n=1 Tax=Salibacterium salarium TaxID=284579 RepID=A0A3R9WMQ7_9BACI|nr:hypothetical protein [Salibacterium salarium]RSL29717.1 hypothetical protein D7Z54_29760 [Salibacterium salarium]